jgi:hypothetical protein
MNAENMNELIEKLLAKEIIKPMTVECSDDFGWYDDNQKQYIVIDFDFMVTYCNDDGYITDLEGFGKDSENNWYGYTFDDSMIELETVVNPNNCDDTVHNDDGSLKCPVYTNIYNIQLWRKESL